MMTRRALVTSTALVVLAATVGIVVVDRRYGDAVARATPQRLVASFAPGKYVGRGGYFYQRRKGECGPVCLANLLIATGQPCVSPAVMLGTIDDPTRGMRIAELEALATTIGLTTTFKIGAAWKDLDGHLPGIALVNTNHYVLIVRQDDRDVLVVDPALGMFVWSRNDLEDRWDGVLLYEG